MRPSGARFLDRLGAIVRLSVPVTAARIGMLTVVMVDTAMTGHAGNLQLAFYGLAHAIHMVCLLVGAGMLIGTAVLSAQALGAGDHRDCGVIWRVALLHGLVLGCLFAALGFTGGAIYTLLGHDAALAQGAGRTLAILNLGLPGQFAFIASTLVLESLGRPRPGVLVMIGVNLLNAGLNWLLIYGHWGVGALGAEGAAWATVAARTAAGLAMLWCVLRMADGERYNLRGPLHRAAEISRKLRHLGYPLGLAQGLESLAFASLTIFAGYLGANSVAAFQIVINLIAFCYMGAIGIGTATAVFVGHAVGRRDRPDMARSGWGGLLAIVLFMSALALVMALFPHLLGRIFTSDEVLLAIVAPTLLIGAATLVGDGAQGVLMGALRGAGDVWIPTAMHLCSFLLVMVPAAAGFAFLADLGTPGLMLGTLIGVSLASCLLAGRFRLISGRGVDRL
ncbi:MAG: MATE family efflux transporter [Alphaproteobacteria bacterium]|nr:MATE family efflux transporter [Alphaproteobacteria bacterium]MDP6813803.1 MATE family efflux transporter [Alphaproteobacteria bacterium]